MRDCLEEGRKMKKLVIGVMFVLVFCFGTRAEEVVVSFEEKEGFPAPGTNFTDMGIPVDKLINWTNDSVGANTWFIDDGPGGASYPDAPPPISGTQIAGFGGGGVGINIGTIHFKKEAKLGLTSFYWAWRGNGDSRPGGSAWLEVEYFDLKEKSVGKDIFQGGLNPDWSPKFELAEPSLQGGALSRVVFKGVTPDPAIGHGTFFLDDITLSVISKLGKFRKIEMPLSKFRKVDTTPPTVNLATPPPDSTVSGPAEIGAKFSDLGSGVDVSSVRIFLDDNEVSSQTKVTTKGFTVHPQKALATGIHRVKVVVSDKAGNRGNSMSWRFGVDTPVPVEVKFEKGIFLVSGEPYFPMGIYNGSCDPTAPGNLTRPYLAQAGIAGINFQILSESLGPDQLDIMLRHGMKAMKAVSSALAAISEENRSRMVQLAVGMKDHPAFLGWWASDPDTMEETRKNMALGYEILKKNDPRHPVIWILSHGDKYKQSLATSDALFTYFYPILQGNMSVHSLYDRVIKPAFEVAAPAGKHVWFGSQAIDLRICEGERLASPKDFRPTAAEIRVMNYLALAKGVKGLLFYAGGGSPTPGVYNDLTEYPSQWQEALKIAGEVRYLSPVLAAGKLVQTVRLEPESPAIHYRELEKEGVHTLIAVNVGPAPVSVTWRFSEPAQPLVLFEDRVLSKKAREMSDKFESLEVHIYRWE